MWKTAGLSGLKPKKEPHTNLTWAVSVCVLFTIYSITVLQFICTIPLWPFSLCMIYLVLFIECYDTCVWHIRDISFLEILPRDTSSGAAQPWLWRTVVAVVQAVFLSLVVIHLVTASPLHMFSRKSGIWHTGIIVYGKEYFFGGGLQAMPHETFVQMHGGVRPTEYIDLGATDLPQVWFYSYIIILKGFFLADYHTWRIPVHRAEDAWSRRPLRPGDMCGELADPGLHFTR